MCLLVVGTFNMFFEPMYLIVFKLKKGFLNKFGATKKNYFVVYEFDSCQDMS